MADACRKRVGWKVASLSPGMASVRYRALLPYLALQGAGVEGVLFTTGMEADLSALDALVIVKSFAAEDLHLAQAAAERGMQVIFDLCDNIFLESYKADVKPVQVLAAMAPYLDCVVVPTEPLANKARLAMPGVEIRVIPDGIETPELVQRGTMLLRAAVPPQAAQRPRVYREKMRTVAFILRQEGPSAMPRLAWQLLNRVSRSARQRIAQARRSWANARTSLADTVADVPEVGCPGLQRIVWFGNHGAPHGRFGMLDLLEIRDALESVAREFEVELVVISNNREKYEKFIRPLAVPSRYVEWSTKEVDRWLAQASVVVIPNTLDDFSICKSANRTVLAVARGVPVVATPTPALEVFKGQIHTGNPLDGLRLYLSQPEAGRRDAQAAFRTAQAAFGSQALASQWLSLLAEKAARPRPAGKDYRCVVALNLIQDLDLAVPVVEALQRHGLPAEVWCSSDLFEKSPRVLSTLREKRMPFRVVLEGTGAAIAAWPAGASVLVTVAETNLGPHRFARELSEIALARGLKVVTLQHGFENVGLSYDDAKHPIDQINFKAQRIYTWGPDATLHPRISPDVKERCVPVGCPKYSHVPAADLRDSLPAGRAVVGVFENLHWHRYSESYRDTFLRAVRLLADEFPEVCFLVKPHHAGLWLTKRYDGEKPDAPNLIISDPQSAAWENHTASALLGHMAAVITTPSTVALDAARRALPVAVFAGDLDLTNYQPLPLLKTEADWRAFVAAALHAGGRTQLGEQSIAFVERVLVPGDAAGRIAADIASMINERVAQEA